MASKTLVVLGALLATHLLLSSEAAARELIKQHEEKVSDAGAVEQKHGGGPRGHLPYIPYPPVTPHHNCPYSPCCKRNLAGHCEYCCPPADEKPDTKYPPQLRN